MMPRYRLPKESTRPLGVVQLVALHRYSRRPSAPHRQVSSSAVSAPLPVNYSRRVSLLRRKPADQAPELSAPVAETPTVGKGRPTPKRSEAQGRRGPVAPPPKTQREAIKRSKEVGKTLTKDEKRVAVPIFLATN